MVCAEKSGSGHSRADEAKRPGLSEALAQVREQIESDCFYDEQAEHVNEICLIIAEVYILPPCCRVKISGEQLTAQTVSEVYKMLTHEHILMVLENLNGIRYRVKHTKAYTRAALYNSVFEYAGHYENMLNAEGGI